MISILEMSMEFASVTGRHIFPDYVHLEHNDSDSLA